MFADFSELTFFTAAFIIAALVGGALAVAFKKKTKPILITTGAVLLVIVAAAVITFAVKGNDAAGFGDIDISSLVFSIIIAVLVAVMIILLIISGKTQKWKSHDLAFATMSVAMSFILSCIKLYSLPQGGSITPAQFLPILLYISVAGPMRGVVVGFAYGLLQLLQGAYVINPMQLLVDYPIAFGALALGGIVKYIKMPEYFKLPAAVLLGYIGRYIMAAVSGAVFFAEYAGDMNPWIYSIGYNAVYIFPDCAVCIAVALIPAVGKLRKLIETKTV